MRKDGILDKLLPNRQSRALEEMRLGVEEGRKAREAHEADAAAQARAEEQGIADEIANDPGGDLALGFTNPFRKGSGSGSLFSAGMSGAGGVNARVRKVTGDSQLFSAENSANEIPSGANGIMDANRSTAEFKPFKPRLIGGTISYTDISGSYN